MNINKFKKITIFLLYCFFSNLLHAEDVGQAFQHDSAQTIRVGLLTTHPFVYINTNNTYSGLSFDIWQEIASINNFQSEYINAGEYINIALEKLANNEFDILIGNIGLFSDRFNKGYYSLPLIRDENIILGLKKNESFFEIYNALFGSNFLLIIFLIFTIYFGYINLFWFFERHDYPEIANKNYWHGISYLFWLSSLSRGFTHPVFPKRIMTKIISLLWSTILVSIFFSLIFGLTTTFLNKLKNQDELFLTKKDLKKKSIVFVGSQAAEKIAHDSNISIALRTDKISTAVSLLKSKKFDAIFTAYSYANTYIQENPNSNLYISPIKFPDYQSAIMVNFQNKQLLYPINSALLKIAENGKKKELCKKYEKFIKYESCFWY